MIMQFPQVSLFVTHSWNGNAPLFNMNCLAFNTPRTPEMQIHFFLQAIKQGMLHIEVSYG